MLVFPRDPCVLWGFASPPPPLSPSLRACSCRLLASTMSPVGDLSRRLSCSSSIIFWNAVSTDRESRSEKATYFLGAGSGFASLGGSSGSGFRFGDCSKTLETPQTSKISPQGAYIHRVEPSHLTWWAVLGISIETESMKMSNTMIYTLLIAQFGRFQFLALSRLGGVASRAPRRDRVEKAGWRSHVTLPVD